MNVVLLHAFPLDSRMWWPQRDALPGYDVVAPDLYELGETIDESADELLASLSDELVLVGVSMGGYCALRMAARAPDRVRGLVLVGARADADTPERREGRAATIELIERGGAEALWEDMRPKLFGEAAPAHVVERAGAIVLEQDRARLVAAVEALRDRADSTAVAASFPGPLLVAVGDSDPFFSVEDAASLAETAPRGRLEVFAGAGHLPDLEQPARFNPLLTEFLSVFDEEGR